MGHEMFSFDRSEGNDVLGNLNRLTNFAPDSIIHLAGVLGTHELFDNPEEAVQVNIIGTLRILEFCRNYNCGYVGITMPPVFPSIYTATKICTDRIATAYRREHGIAVAKVRAFNVFGSGQAYGPGHPQKIIPTFAVKSWRREPIPIWGDGRQTVDLIDSTQVGRILIEATQYHNDVIFDAGSGTPYTVNEVAAFVNAVTGSLVPNEYLPMRRGEEPTEIVAQGQNWELLSWEPRFDMEALVATVNSYHAQAQLEVSGA